MTNRLFTIVPLLAAIAAPAHPAVGVRILRGLTDNEVRMQAMGFAPYPYRLTAYVIAGTLCGLAGFLLGNQTEFVSPAYMHWQRSGELIMMVLLGGTGTLHGPVLGALAFALLEEVLPRLTEHWKVILGPLLILLALFAKGGIAGAIANWRRETLRKAQGAALGHLARADDGRTLGAQRMRDALRPAAPGLGNLARLWRGAKMVLGSLLISLLLVLFDRRRGR